jgi:DNA-binding protein H-NS
MAKKSLASMTSDALVKLRDQVSAILGRRADSLKKELRSLGEDYKDVGRIALYGRKSLAGRKVAPKYRDPKTKATWAGRGATPVWMREAIQSGKKREDFLIVKTPRKAKKKSRVKRKGR